MKRQRSATTTPYKNRPFKRPRRAALAKIVRVVPVTENHYFDSERTETAVPLITTVWTGTELDPNTTAMLCLFAPTVGNDLANREARKCFVKKIKISGVITVPKQADQTGGDNASKIRLILYCDKQTNGAQSQGEDLINSGAANGAINMFQNSTNFGRFRVLKDKTLIFQNPNTVNDLTNIEQGGLKKEFKMTVNVNMWVNFNATNGGTVADIIDNSFHFIAGTDVGELVPSLNYKSRVVFTP